MAFKAMPPDPNPNPKAETAKARETGERATPESKLDFLSPSLSTSSTPEAVMARVTHAQTEPSSDWAARKRARRVKRRQAMRLTNHNDGGSHPTPPLPRLRPRCWRLRRHPTLPPRRPHRLMRGTQVSHRKASCTRSKQPLPTSRTQGNPDREEAGVNPPQGL